MQQPEPQKESQDEMNKIREKTDNLNQELKEMKRLIQDMQMHGSEKDAELIKMNMHLMDEKKKMQDLQRQQLKSKAVSPKGLTPDTSVVNLNYE